MAADEKAPAQMTAGRDISGTFLNSEFYGNVHAYLGDNAQDRAKTAFDSINCFLVVFLCVAIASDSSFPLYLRVFAAGYIGIMLVLKFYAFTIGKTVRNKQKTPSR